MNLYNLINGEISLEDLLNYYNATITYLKLPKGIDGCVFNYDGIYNIFIKIGLTDSKKRETLLHELAHIELNQFNQINNEIFALKTTKYEDEADRYIEFLLSERRL